MVHRDPMLAALARCAQLEDRIHEIDPRAVRAAAPPRTLSDAIAHGDRLEHRLRELERRRVERDAEPAMAVVVDDELEPPHDERPAWRTEMALGVLLCVMVGSIVLDRFFVQAKADWTPDPPRDAVTAHLAGVVVTTSGDVAPSAGARCTIVIADGEVAPERTCRINVQCPGLEQGFITRSCPMGDAEAPLRIEMKGLAIDTREQTATFIVNDAFGTPRGSATLRLDARTP